MASRFTLPHIDIVRFHTSQTYVGSGGGGAGEARIRAEHGRRVQNELTAALRVADESRSTDGRLEPVEGTFVEVELRRGTKPDALDRKREGVRSGAAKLEDDGERTIALFIPDAARQAFERILHDYVNGPLTERGRNPPNQTLVEAIEAFRVARLETFWTDDPNALPADVQQEMWWGLWCHKGSEAKVREALERLDVRIASEDKWQKFPEISVIPVLANRSAIELVLFATAGIAELRRASDSPVFFVDECAGDQQDWVDDLAERTVWPGSDAPAVCIMDTGVNRAHALIEPALAVVDTQAVDRRWGVDDHDPDGHGTSMAGLALHGNLVTALSDREKRQLAHRVESVKILPPRGFDAAEPHNYGPITQAAIALPEIAAPERPRVYCMAVTNDNVSGSIPSAWSAALDQAAAGTMAGDGDDAPKRLILVSGGNTPAEVEYARIRPQGEHPIEDPAQAWNALTVGGYTDLIDVRDKGYEHWNPMANAGELSPHSRTSETWAHNSPFKPEIVLEAGNRIINPARTEALTVTSLSLLSTGRDPHTPLVPFQATSAATAQAARLAAKLCSDHPEFWPETVRALMVHSAEWTPHMLAMFEGARGKRDRYKLVRHFGYGVPDYERATASARNHLALFAQTEIQPFKLEGGRKFGDCHYYDLPIPRRLLEDLHNETVELKITLSYFIDPNPGLSANIDPQRYQSHGLRFDLRRKNEPLETFKRRVNASERDDPRARPRVVPDDDRWLLGASSVSSGSLHCDVWTGPAIELAGRDKLCVKPVVGWCRQRATPEVCETLRRYALIVSLKARDPDIDLYTPISVAVGVPVGIEVET